MRALKFNMAKLSVTSSDAPLHVHDVSDVLYGALVDDRALYATIGKFELDFVACDELPHCKVWHSDVNRTGIQHYTKRVVVV